MQNGIKAILDVPSPIDFSKMEDAQAWADTAMKKRPFREEFFGAFVDALGMLRQHELSVLELGSGPGFLAQRVLQSLPETKYTMLDFSPAMHILAQERLGALAEKVQLVIADFKEDAWATALPLYDAVVTMQAVHELRHKQHALKLHTSVSATLRKGGTYLVCDHYAAPEAMTNTDLYMTIEEQQAALQHAGFKNIKCILQKCGLVLHTAA